MTCPDVVAMYMHPLLLQTYSLLDTILIIDSEYDIKFASIINKNQYTCPFIINMGKCTMKTRLKTTLLLCGFPFYVSAQYIGKVYVDENYNGKYDAGETLLNKVSVSDGLNVVQTNQEGSFNLAGHEKAKFIFITTPSGYKTNNAYYRRIEAGRTAYDFGVIPYQNRISKDGSHRFIQISDTEIGSPQGQERWVQEVKDYAANEKAAFIIHTGDICYIPGLKSHLGMMNTMNMDTQMFYAIGNHDLVQGDYGEQVFESIYGPTFYSFEVGNAHYIVTPMLGGDYQPDYTKKDVYEWLKNDLKYVSKEKAVYIFNHDLLTADERMLYQISDNEFIELDKHNLKAWIYGHWHVNHIHKHRSAYSVCTSTLACGGIDHASSAFRVFSVDGKGDFQSELRYTFINRTIELASISNGQAPVNEKGELPLSVNVYHTVSPVQKVTYDIRCNRQVWIKAQSMKKNTNFNWSALVQLPENCKKRLVTVVAEAYLSNGEIIKTEESFVYNDTRSTTRIQTSCDWTNLLRTPNHIGGNEANAVAPLRLAWVQNVKSNIYMTSPLVYKGNVYVASVDEDAQGKATLMSMEGETGKIRWKYMLDGSVKNSIAITDEVVFAQDVHSTLYAVDVNTGNLIWKKKMGTEAIPSFDGGIIAADGIVYAGTGQTMCAIEALSGKICWINKDWKSREGCTVTLSLEDGVLVGGAHWDAMYANDARTGQLLWTNRKDGLRNRSASPVLKDGILYVPSLSSFFIMNAHTGEILMRKELGYNVDVTSSPLITDELIIFGTAERGVVALDKSTLEEKWNFQTTPSFIYSAPYTRYPACTVETSPVQVGNNVYFTASDGILYALDIQTGKQIWRYTMGAPSFASVAVSGNALFVADFSGNVYGFVSDTE